MREPYKCANCGETVELAFYDCDKCFLSTDKERKRRKND